MESASTGASPDEAHFRQSVLREIVVEHLLIGRLLQRLWQRGLTDVEVLRSEFDAGGYDLVLSRGNLVRHVQLKTKLAGGRSGEVSVSLKLAARPSGCVIWVVLRPDLETDHFLWFGGEPGHPLPSLNGLNTTKHVRANAKGEKAARPDHRLLPSNRFQRINKFDELIGRLLGI